MITMSEELRNLNWLPTSDQISVVHQIGEDDPLDEQDAKGPGSSVEKNTEAALAVALTTKGTAHPANVSTLAGFYFENSRAGKLSIWQVYPRNKKRR